MARSMPALATPSVLKFGRTSAGFDLETAATRSSVAASTLEGWENGSGALSLATLKKLAKLYRRPLAWFFLPEPPEEAGVPEDYRSASGDDGEARAELTLQVRRVRELREVALRLDGSSAAVTPVPRASLDDKPSEVAKRLREWLGVDVATQRRWKDVDEAYRRWRARFEELGILVLQFTRVPVATARGFSIAGDRLPVIAVNSRDKSVARSFTLMHELAHLALRRVGICDFTTGKSSGKAIERFCNAVAAETIVPAGALNELLPESGTLDVDALARSFKVSTEAMSLRLIAAKRLPEAEYETFRRRYISEVEEERQRRKELRDANAKGPGADRLVVTNLGRPFLRLLVDGYYEGIVSAPEFRDYTSIKVTRLDKLEALVGERA